jgi:MFS transporter, MFS domain-containing protein family, molybdate-anion transporter
VYTFVFLWTPALSPHGEGIPHGLIFSLFMLSCMAGAAIGGHLLSKKCKPEYFMQWVFLASALALCVPVWVHYARIEGMHLPAQDVNGITLTGKMLLIAFCAFEVCIGVFWPSLMSLRAKHFPDDTRGTLMNCFRIPMNLLVCFMLYNVHLVPMGAIFGLCVGCLMLCFLGCQHLEMAVIKDPALVSNSEPAEADNI